MVLKEIDRKDFEAVFGTGVLPDHPVKILRFDSRLHIVIDGDEVEFHGYTELTDEDEYNIMCDISAQFEPIERDEEEDEEEDIDALKAQGTVLNLLSYVPLVFLLALISLIVTCVVKMVGAV